MPLRIEHQDGHSADYVYDASGVKLQMKNNTVGMALITKDYRANKVYENTVLKMILTEDGYVEPNSGSFNYYFFIKDHLGNNRVVADKNGTVAQITNYYPFGMSHAEVPARNDQHKQPYKFNGKELDRMFGLDTYDYSARMYSPAIGRFMTMDPLAEKYYSISPYAYCANNPILYVDRDGREISFSYEYEKDEYGNYIKNKNGGYNLLGITMNVTGKVINISSNSKVNMADATKRISSQLESSFRGEINGVTFSTNANLSVANSMNDVSDSDHVFALANLESPSGTTLQGVASSFGGKVEFIDADYFTGPLDTSIGNVGPGTSAHEFGHLAGLKHSSGLMMNQPGGILWMTSTKINSCQLNEIHSNRALLNQGVNSERIGTKVMPYRGSARPYVRHGY